MSIEEGQKEVRSRVEAVDRAHLQDRPLSSPGAGPSRSPNGHLAKLPRDDMDLSSHAQNNDEDEEEEEERDRQLCTWAV